jgi:hypothetical protein
MRSLVYILHIILKTGYFPQREPDHGEKVGGRPVGWGRQYHTDRRVSVAPYHAGYRQVRAPRLQPSRPRSRPLWTGSGPRWPNPQAPAITPVRGSQPRKIWVGSYVSLMTTPSNTETVTVPTSHLIAIKHGLLARQRGMMITSAAKGGSTTNLLRLLSCVTGVDYPRSPKGVDTALRHIGVLLNPPDLLPPNAGI